MSVKRPEYYSLKGREVMAHKDVMEWAKTCKDWFYNKHVGHDKIGDVTVSTVFLGINHNWGEGPPILFETMIFGGPLDETQFRYSTYDDAEAGHAVQVKRVKALVNTN